MLQIPAFLYILIKKLKCSLDNLSIKKKKKYKMTKASFIITLRKVNLKGNFSILLLKIIEMH